MSTENICGIVVSHAKRGTGLGYPTANIELGEAKPEIGVYAAHVTAAGTRYPAAVFVGPAETFGEEHVKLEAHLLDVNIDLYNQEICVQLHTKIRKHQKFATVDELVTAIEEDIKNIRICLQELPNN